MEKIVKYIENEEKRYLSELIDFLKIPSISSLPEHNGDMLKCAEWLSDNIKAAGFEDVQIISTAGHPLVYAEWLGAGKGAATVLVYGHYDVKPVDPLDLWDSPPFEPAIRDGKIYGRGTSDDKGQAFCHVKGLEALFRQNGKLPVNVKLLIEGEEECGGENLVKFINENAEMLKCDTVLISDTEWFDDGLPSICYSLRGIAFVEVHITGPNRDVHSGTYGGAIDNPINILCWMISKLKDQYGRITIPGFYDDVLELTDKERIGFKELPFNIKAYKHGLGINFVHGEMGYTTLERSTARPSLDVNGIKGGFQGGGAKTIIPSQASAKISMRLVPNQRADDITEKITAYLKTIAPQTVSIRVEPLHGGNPVLVSQDSKGVRAAINAIKKAFGKEPAFTREGGSIPIVELFSEVLNARVVLMALGLPDDNIHSPNEKLDLKNFYGGIKASAHFFEEMGKL